MHWLPTFMIALALSVVDCPLARAGEGGEPPPDPPHDQAPHHDQSPHYDRLFPLGAQRAIDRGYQLPRPFGVSIIVTDTRQPVTSSDLSVAFGKGSGVPDGSQLIPLPFVTTDHLRGSTSGYQVKGDMWLFPYLNLFASVGQIKGHMDIGVNIDVNAFLPPPICGPRHPCPDQHLRFRGNIDNTTVTFGGLVVYGTDHWFVSGSAAQTLSIPSAEKSDIRTTDASIRVGPRVPMLVNGRLALYLGANYFDIDTRVEGVYRVPGVFADGDELALRYEAQLENPSKWSALLGFNAELDERWMVQGEYVRVSGGHRLITSLTRRF